MSAAPGASPEKIAARIASIGGVRKFDPVEEEVRSRVLVDPGEIAEAVQDRREEEPRQEQRLEQVLDVAVESVQRRDGEREAGDDAGEERAERDREPDRVARLRELPQAQRRSRRPASRRNETRFVPTIDSGTSWRGNRTLRMRFAFSSRLRDAACDAVAKNTQAGSPHSRKSQ